MEGANSGGASPVKGVGRHREAPGVVLHIWSRTPKGRVLFPADEDRVDYLVELAETGADRDWRIYSFCLMRNHVHLLIRAPDGDIGTGLQKAHEHHTRRVHERHDGHEALFGRLQSKPVLTTDHFLGELRYFGCNPVVAGICTDAADYRWSAHRELAGLIEPTGVVAVQEALETIGDGCAHRGRATYISAVGHSDERLVAMLREAATDSTWVARAVRDYGISVDRLADLTGISPRTLYRKLGGKNQPG